MSDSYSALIETRKADGQRKNRNVEVENKVYLSFPKGRFRISDGSTKLATRNDGPYAVIEKLQDGLVLQRDAKRVHPKHLCLRQAW